MKRPLLGVLLLSLACTSNSRARFMGGAMTVNLPRGVKLVNATWKEEDLWYLTRPMREGETPETVTFTEKSSMGAFEGTVVFQEAK